MRSMRSRTEERLIFRRPAPPTMTTSINQNTGGFSEQAHLTRCSLLCLSCGTLVHGMNVVQVESSKDSHKSVAALRQHTRLLIEQTLTLLSRRLILKSNGGSLQNFPTGDPVTVRRL